MQLAPRESGCTPNSKGRSSPTPSPCPGRGPASSPRGAVACARVCKPEAELRPGAQTEGWAADTDGQACAAQGRRGPGALGTAVAGAQVYALDHGHLHTDTHSAIVVSCPGPCSNADGVLALLWAMAQSFCCTHCATRLSPRPSRDPMPPGCDATALPASPCGSGES